MFFLMFLLLIKTTYFSDACVFVQVVFFFNLFKMNCSFILCVSMFVYIYVCVCFRASSSASTLIPLGIYLEPTLKLVSFYDFYINLSLVELCCCGIE